VDIRIPVETYIDNETGKEVEEKVYPSYVLVKMVMTDETWHVVRNISGVTEHYEWSPY
jgi:transcriptional antiterminator NusG